MKKNLLLYFFLLPFFYLLLQGCVETITDPPDKLAPRLEVWAPASEDTLTNGRNEISYYAEDDIGLSHCEVYVNGILNDTFSADSNHVLPKIYISLDESMISAKISYYVTVYDLWGNATSCTQMKDLLVVENTSIPDQPEDFSVQQISENIIKLAWTDVSDNETGFEIWRRDASSAYQLFKILPKNFQAAYDSTINPNNIFYYKIRAINKFGKSKYSSEVNSEGIGPLSAPAKLTATALGTNLVKLNWQDKSTQETKFKIERKNTGEGSFILLAYVDSNKTEYTDRYSMYAGGAYTYRILAQNSTDKSEWSNEADVVTLSENISTPANLKAELLTDTRKVKLTWNDYGNTAIEAKIERKLQNSSFSVIGSVDAVLKTYTDSSVAMGNHYTYRVRTLTNQGNYSPYSDEVSVYIPIMPPNTPTDLKLTKFNSSQFNLQWKDNSDDEDGFQLWRSDGTPNNYRIIRQLGPNAFSINDEVSNTSIIYYYKVRAYRDTSFSSYSNIINSTGGTGLYPRPGEFAATALCPSRVKLTWIDNTSDELGFIIERKTSWGTFTQIALLSPGTQLYIDSGLTSGIEYIYRIKVFSSTQESDWSDEVHVMMPVTGDCGG